MNFLKNRNNLILLSVFFGLFIDIVAFLNKKFISFFINVSFFVLILLTFLKINFGELKKIKRFFKPVLLIFVFDYLIFPLLILFLVKFKVLSIELAIPLLFLILAPSAISSIYLVSLVKGNKEESLVIVLFTHLIFLFVLPVIISIYSIFLGETSIKVKKIIELIIVFLFLPITLAYFLQKSGKLSFLYKNKEIIDNFLYTLLLIIIFVVVSLNFSQLSKNPLDYLIEIMLITIYFLVYFFITTVFFKEKKEERTVLLEFTYKNYIIAFILLSNFNNKFLILPIIYVIMANIFLFIYLNYFEKKGKF